MDQETCYQCLISLDRLLVERNIYVMRPAYCEIAYWWAYKHAVMFWAMRWEKSGAHILWITLSSPSDVPTISFNPSLSHKQKVEIEGCFSQFFKQ